MLTDWPGGAADMARKLAESGEELRLYACEGDGTISQVANGIAGVHNAAMSVIPIGTGNDILKNFGEDREKFSDVENLWNGEVITDDFAWVSMCNGRYYGGGSTPVPEARIDDGVLHTILIKKVGRTAFAWMFGAYSAGEYRKLPSSIVRASTAREVRIRAGEDIVTCLDGKCFRGREVVMGLADKKLNFFGPGAVTPTPRHGTVKSRCFQAVWQALQILHNFCQNPPLQTWAAVL